MPAWPALAFVLAISQTPANSPKPVIIQMSFGFAGNLFSGRATGWPFRAGHWNWLIATVHNPVDRDLDAALTFHIITPPETGRFGLTKKFRLPRQSALRISFPVCGAAPDVTRRQSAYGVLELKVDGEVTDERRAEITFLDDNIYAIGVLGDAERLAESLAATPLYPNRGPELQSAGIVRTLAVSDAQVPEDPLGLDFLHTLIVVHASTRELRPGQWSAIDEWVQAGGNLIFVLGNDTAAQMMPDIRPILPAFSIGTRRVTVLPALGDWSGESLKFDDGIEVGELVATSGQVLVRDGQVPLVVQSQRGLGQVCCVAINPERGLSTVRAYKQFWLEVLRRLHPPRAIDKERLEPFADSLVEQFAGRKVVGVWLPLVIVGAYFVVIFLLVREVQGRRATQRRWVGVCAAAIAFTGTSYTLLWAIAPTPVREVFDIWVASGKSPTETVQIEAYRSILPAARGDSTVQINDRLVKVVPTMEKGAAVVDSAVQYRGSSVSYQAEKSRVRTLHLAGQIALPGLIARARTALDSVIVEFENHTAYDLENCFFKLGRRVQPLGALARGERRVIEIKSATQPANSYESEQFLDSSSRLRHSILRTLFVDPATQSDEDILVKVFRGPEQGTSSGSLFGGWIDRSLIDMSWDDTKGAKSRALGLVAIEPEWQSTDERFWVPRGAMRLTFPQPGARQYYFGQSAFRGDQPVPSSMLLEFTVPPWVQSAEIEQAILFVQFVSDAYGLVVKMAGEQLPLPEVPSGRFSIPMAAAASPNNGTIQLQLVVEPRPGFTDELSRQGYRWSLREIELECTCRRLPADHD